MGEYMEQIQPGLEVSTRRDEHSSGYVQDQYPTVYLQDELRTAYNEPPFRAAAQEARPREGNWDGRLEENSAAELKAKESKICGIKRLTFWLGLAVGVLVVVAAVGGGVLSSRIGKGSGSKSSQSLPFFPPTSTVSPSLLTSYSVTPTSTVLDTLAPPAADDCAAFRTAYPDFWRVLFSSRQSSTLSPSLSTSHTATLTSTVLATATLASTVLATLAPPAADDCAAFSTPYTADVSGNLFQLKPSTTAVFDIYCRTDFVKGDFTTFYAPSLLTCMNGCATFNYWQDYNGVLAKMNCSGVVYQAGPKLPAFGNCYLKRGGYVTDMVRNQGAAYARLRSAFAWGGNGVGR